MAALEKVVNIDSGTFNTEGVREVGRLFEKELQTLGFKTRWIPMPDAMHRGGHLVAERVSQKPSGKLEFDDIVPGWPITEGNRSI